MVCRLYWTCTGPEPKPALSGNNRTFRVWMDTNQYQRDMARVVQGEEVRLQVYVCSVDLVLSGFCLAHSLLLVHVHNML